MTDWLAPPVRRGHVRRSRSDADGRAWILSLTKAGQQTMMLGYEAFGRAYEAFLAHTTVSPEELAASLDAMTEAIIRATEDLD